VGKEAAMRENLEQVTVLRDEDESGSNRSGNPHIQKMIDAGERFCFCDPRASRTLR
jgi:hypothetical protein